MELESTAIENNRLDLGIFRTLGNRLTHLNRSVLVRPFASDLFIKSRSGCESRACFIIDELGVDILV